MAAGFTFDGVAYVGLVGEIDWGQWLSDDQQAHTYGSEGTSVIRGALQKREFTTPMMIYGYTTQLEREAAILAFERKISTVAGLQIRIGGNTQIFSQNANVQLIGVKRGRTGADAIHLHYASLMIMWRQLLSRGSQ